MSKSKSSLLSLIGLVSVLSTSVFAESPNLPAFGVDLSQTSVSGLSSGAFMTAQLNTAYSASFIGAGIIAGGPFYCSGTYGSVGNMQSAMSTCMNPLSKSVGPNAEISFKNAQKFASEGKIDDVENLKKQKVYLFSGSSDSTVKTIVVDQVKAYYNLAGVPDENIKYEHNINAGHSIVTKAESDVPCAVTKAPFINNCGFQQSQDLLNHIYGELNPPTTVDKLSGRIIAFNQKEFIKGSRSSMSDDAYIYVPKSCETEACRVHIAIHGCLQGAAQIGDRYYNTTTGYNEIADTNNIIVLYPQAQISKTIPANPQGCWDFWGYSSEDPSNLDFYTKNAPQMSAIMAMVKRLGEPRQTN
ncbi:MAG: poly(3-hydroxybutyrate) depolymerase [Thiotrichaceae bacterium]|nr:poly(3-hydroxybutyrate) depolymerase [Thiotrichaceae bacterium]